MPRATTERVSPLRDRAAYPLHEAAWYVRVAPATLRSWVLGRKYETSHGPRHWQPLIAPADPRNCVLSFNNLVEAHVLRALRTSHGSRIKQIRKALSYASKDLEIPRLLLSRELSTHAGDLLLERLGELINLTKSGQFAMKRMLEAHLKRVERDVHGFPIRLFPFVIEDGQAHPVVAIDPAVGFGRPIIQRKAIATRTIVDRIDAGESPEAIAEDYELDRIEVDEAILYERAAA